MKKNTTGTYILCEACHRPIRDGDGQRIINSFRLHVSEECLISYTQKVEKGILKVPYTMGHKAVRA